MDVGALAISGGTPAEAMAHLDTIEMPATALGGRTAAEVREAVKGKCVVVHFDD
jgi:hypothetical protein